jgi:hypothetical protein
MIAFVDDWGRFAVPVRDHADRSRIFPLDNFSPWKIILPASVLPPKTDILLNLLDVRGVPTGDIRLWARRRVSGGMAYVPPPHRC